MYSQFIAGLPGFLRQRYTPEDARREVLERLNNRERNFLALLDAAVFSRPESPYQFIMREARCEPGDVRQLVKKDGVDAAMEKLYDGGVSVSFDEFKGRKPIVRNGRTLATTSESFDNPLATKMFEGQSGGSTGVPTSVTSGLAHIEDQTAMMILGHEANGILGGPVIVYRAGFPSATANKTILRHILIGNPVRRWFSPVAIGETRSPMRFRMAEALTPHLVRLFGSPYPRMEIVPYKDSAIVARAAAEFVRAEGSCLVRCPVSTALTVSISARENGIDLKGVTFSGTGEPPSPGKVAGINASGARYVTTYSMAEVGPVGVACAAGLDDTDVHVMRDKVAVVQRAQTLAGAAEPVGVFFLTSLLASGPKLLINTSVDDFGILEERECGCQLGAIGLNQHIRQIRSVSKLTGRGVTLVASDILHIIEEVLPRRFGGTPQDYQLVEDEDSSGLTSFYLLVSPTINLPDENAPAEAMLDALLRGSAAATIQSAMLRGGGAVRVRRQQPRPNSRGKLPAFKTVAST